MKELIPLIKQIEIEMRSNNGNVTNQDTLEKMSELTDWENKIVLDAMLRVKEFMSKGDYNFVYKKFEEYTSFNYSVRNEGKKVDVIIACLRRDLEDLCLTDVWNKLVMPAGVSYDILEIWGIRDICKARNLAVEQALKKQAKYLMFIDDDILMEIGTFLKLWNIINTHDTLCASGLYYKKLEPLSAPFENKNGEVPIDGGVHVADQICGMGCFLMNIEEITKHVPLPLFHAFGDGKGYMSMGEDAWYVKNLIEHTGKPPLVDTSIKCLHVDKTWKKIYGERDNETVYATGIWDTNDIKYFDRMRVPPNYPLVLICIPTRTQDEPIAVNLNDMLLHRGYRSELFRPYGYDVDIARQLCVEEALKRNADYVLFIDNDVVPAAESCNLLIETMEKISKEKNEICAVSGVYYMKGQSSCGYAHLNLDPITGLVTDLNRIEYKDKIIQSNWLIGLGFCLIPTYCFKSMRKPYFKCYSKTKEQNVNEDAHFSELMFENGFNIYINLDIECLHVDFANGIIYGDTKLINYAVNPGIFENMRFFDTVEKRFLTDEEKALVLEAQVNPNVRQFLGNSSEGSKHDIVAEIEK